jgi:hypothetical protein
MPYDGHGQPMTVDTEPWPQRSSRLRWAKEQATQAVDENPVEGATGQTEGADGDGCEVAGKARAPSAAAVGEPLRRTCAKFE